MRPRDDLRSNPGYDSHDMEANASTTKPDGVAEQLQKARERLLDLNLTNRLLNYRAPKTASIHIVDEVLGQVWNRLLSGGKMEFLSREAPAAAGSIKEAAPEPEEDSAETFTQPKAETGTDGAPLAERYTDRYLQTAHPDAQLQTRLLRLHQLARTVVEETGVNVLFLAMGFIHWRPEGRDELVKAPIFLLPVALERTSVRQRFTIKAGGDEPVLNPCLVMKLQRDYRIKLPEEPEEWEGFDPAAYLESVREAIKGREQWVVADEMHLGMFSFTKYLMYLDLDEKRWAEGAGPPRQRLVRAMCGDRAALAGEESPFPRPQEMDAREDPAEVFQVVDADSSQQAVIAAVKAGRSMVIQGPPGTGKSQTITNLIAECLAGDKSVLFVSQKKAALEVVQGRLSKAGLADFCLELHSTKAHRAELLAELERVLALRPAPRPDGDHLFERFKQLRAHLNAYVQSLHEPIGKTGVTPYAAIGQTARMSSVPHIAAAVAEVDNWTPADLTRQQDLIALLARQLEAVWPAMQHAWRGSCLTSLPMQLREELDPILQALTTALVEAAAAARESAAVLGLAAPPTPAVARVQLGAGELVLESPGLPLSLIDDPRWDAETPEVMELLQWVKAYAELKGQLQDRYQLEPAAGVDWDSMLQRSLRRGFISRLISPGYWRDRSQLKAVSRENYRPGWRQRLADLRQLAGFQKLSRQIGERQDLGRRMFDAAWKGADSAPDDLVRIAQWLLKARSAAKQGLLPETARRLCAVEQDKSPVRTAVTRLQAALRALDEQFGRLKAQAKLQDPGVFETAAMEQSFDALTARAAAMRAGLESLVAWCQYQDALQRCQAAGLAAWVDKAGQAQLEPELYRLAFQKRLLLQLMEKALDTRPSLRSFSARNQEDAVLQFARLDADLLQENRHRLYRKVAGRRPQNGFEAAKSSQLGILQSEIRRKRGGRTIRKILRDAGEVVRQVKPCFMMSPLSVAQYLEPGAMHFDLVVFDEASQVEPADALGAIARGKQLVLVGDRKQLPPTDFFSSLSGEQEPADEGEAGLTDMESILDRGEAVLPAAPLRWHYRSRHESLIQFSNSEFYDGELVVFPSAHRDRTRLGVSLRHDASEMYDRARSRTNRAQARRVAQAVFDYLRSSPEKSLGVVAFSAAQQQAILDELERQRRTDASLEELFRTDRAEPLFVKNLETVQGDERDAIFLSVGHGRAAPGERVGGGISNLAGPDGWRRLNVLITRAREQYVVFSSILGGDMDLAGTSARGVLSFKKYLEFVESGKLPEIQSADGEIGSPFEQAVFDALTEHGIHLQKQVGCAGYAIDLAVLDPQQPERYILGIECDGATYQSSATARDRDRLRQQVLETLGWRIHRIWSTDWFLRPKAELERVLDAIEKARTGQLRPRFVEIGSTIGLPTVIATSEVPESEGKLPLVPTQPYRCFEARSVRSSDAFYTDPDHKLADLVVRIIAAEGPIHEEELQRRVAAQYGIARLGTRVGEKIGRALDRAMAGGQAVRRAKFLWPPGMKEPPIRRREEPLNHNIDLVTVEEMARVMHALVEAQIGIGKEDLINQTARVLGFAPGGTRTRARIDTVITHETGSGGLSIDAEGRLRKTM